MKEKDLKRRMKILAGLKISVLTILPPKNVDLPQFSHSNYLLQSQQRQKEHLHLKKNNTKLLRKRRQFKKMILR